MLGGGENSFSGFSSAPTGWPLRCDWAFRSDEIYHEWFRDGSIPTAPENITVTFLTPTSVRVSWQTSMDPHTLPVDKYDVTYKPTDASYRVVVVVAGNRDAVTLGGLTPDTQYQLTVAAVWNGKKYRSRPIVFRTLEPPRTSYQLDPGSPAGSSGPPNSPHADTAPSLAGIGIFNDEFGNMSVNSTSRELPTIRGVEIGIVVLVLIVWAGAIALFFNRWGKIRMLLPYQPDYKQEQLKVPGTGVCANGTCNGQHSHQHPGADAAPPTSSSIAASEPLNAQPHTHSHPHLAAVARRESSSSPDDQRRHSMALFHAEQHSHRQPLLGGGQATAPAPASANHRAKHHQHHVHPLLQRHRSEDRPTPPPVRPGTSAGRHGVTGCQRHSGGQSKPLLQRPPLAHSHSVGQPHQPHPHHAPHHHRSHPRLSQQHRQKLFSRSKQYTSVCSGGSNSTHYAGDSGTRSRSSREHADDDVESCPYHPWPEEPSSVISERCTRARINSAIFVSSEGKGFDSIEFIRRYGSQSVLCRKAKSAENVSASERQRRFSEYPEWETEDSTTGTSGPTGGGNARRKKSLKPQDSIEMVECHKEPVQVTVPVPPVPTVTPGALPVVAGTTATLVTVGVPIALAPSKVITIPPGLTGNSIVGAAASVGQSVSNGTGGNASIPIVVKPTPKLSNLPTLSVSGPSPPHEEEFL
ncbi:AGAP006721-PA-like protein [Anopheles sinensis]|uniref:AGAP006721-PA-like protein n=1 Tax=Anopheles sinensis TaxID=74873 RepID=A0A084WLK5_ANOSI|nr:AGAP006721-PA-like protein [Anopheles sinensis]